jgi:radial spoke head protein 3
MLNTLVSKTLEQARMLVLEGEELRVMKEQKKDYEEIRNSELLEADRLEAAEIRRKEELNRRKIQ